MGHINTMQTNTFNIEVCMYGPLSQIWYCFTIHCSPYIFRERNSDPWPGKSLQKGTNHQMKKALYVNKVRSVHYSTDLKKKIGQYVLTELVSYF